MNLSLKAPSMFTRTKFANEEAKKQQLGCGETGRRTGLLEKLQ